MCVEQPELKGHDLEFCLYGRRELLRTSGYIANAAPPMGHHWGGRGVGGGPGAHRASPPPPLFCFRYRKIPGDKCRGGENPSREETDMKKKCTSTLLSPGQLVGVHPSPPPDPEVGLGCSDPMGDHVLSPQAASPSPTPIVLAVVAVLLVSAVAAVLLVKKYVCGGRWVPAGSFVPLGSL